MKKQLILLLILNLSAAALYAQQQDADGCKDSKYFKRMPNSFITECATDSDEMEFIINRDSIVRMEGIKTFIAYGYNSAKAKTAPTFARIVKRFEMEAVKRGGKQMYYSGDAGTATLYFKYGDKDIWVVIDDGSGDGEGYYSISILESGGVQ